MGRDCLGYDSTTLFVPPGLAGNRSFLKRLEPKRNDTVTGRSKYACKNLTLEKGRDKETGTERLTITGSLATYMNGDNFHSLSAEEFSAALEKLSDELEIDCGACTLWKVEFAGTFQVSDKPALYFPCFQARPGLHAKNMHSGVYLQQASGALVIHIYDKSDDGNPRTLRLEVRRNRRISRAIGRDYPVPASDLGTPEVFETFARDWQEQITKVLVSPGELPELPERLTRKSFAQVVSQLCRSNPKLLSKLNQIVESYDRAGKLDKNYRPELRRELYGPHSEPENGRLKEISTKIETLSAPFFPALEGAFDRHTKPKN